MPAQYTDVMLPLWIFQCPAFSLNTRVLLAYLKFMNKDYESFPGAHKVAALIGLVDEDGVPTDKNIKAVRQARQQLIKKGVLTHKKVLTKFGESQHRWTINGGPVTASCIEVMNQLDRRATYVNKWGASSVPEPVSTETPESYDEDEDVYTL